ncbi:hypothetical protein ATANTOWER_018524, partial [Ataeniobius toweri]|nr:hypothetical protein [Ataeniobius toweri]
LSQGKGRKAGGGRLIYAEQKQLNRNTKELSDQGENLTEIIPNKCQEMGMLALCSVFCLVPVLQILHLRASCRRLLGWACHLLLHLLTGATQVQSASFYWQHKRSRKLVTLA